MSTSGFPVGSNTYLAQAQDDSSAWSHREHDGDGQCAANQMPTIGSLSVSPDPVTQGNSLTLTANSVADSDGTVAKVEFYRDTNGNGVIDVGTDTLFGDGHEQQRWLDLHGVDKRVPGGEQHVPGSGARQQFGVEPDGDAATGTVNAATRHHFPERQSCLRQRDGGFIGAEQL